MMGGYLLDRPKYSADLDCLGGSYSLAKEHQLHSHLVPYYGEPNGTIHAIMEPLSRASQVKYIIACWPHTTCMSSREAAGRKGYLMPTCSLVVARS